MTQTEAAKEERVSKSTISRLMAKAEKNEQKKDGAGHGFRMKPAELLTKAESRIQWLIR
jgi:hypothetical protein